MKINSMAKKAFERTRASYSYARLSHRLPVKNTFYKLSAAEKHEVDTLWGGFGRKLSYAWHEMFADKTGSFDARYLPGGLFEIEILPKLNSIPMTYAWADKAYYQERFPNSQFPKAYLYCIHGRFYSPTYEPLDATDALRVLKDNEKVFAKPSVDTRTGKGAALLSSEDIDIDYLRQIASNRNSNYVFQQVVRQHPALSQFNESSVNILRMISLRYGGECRLLHTTLRFGIPGSNTDVAFVDGKEIVRGVRVSANGSIGNRILDLEGTTTLLDDDFFTAGRVIPNFDSAAAMCKEIHEHLHHFDLVAFDVAVQENGEPIILEFNIRQPGILVYQFVHGPFFGEYTEGLVKELLKS